MVSRSAVQGDESGGAGYTGRRTHKGKEKPQVYARIEWVIIKPTASSVASSWLTLYRK